ncbi:MAG: 1,4-alpha-glucan branching protein domain-containing protein, partial [Nitrospinota bacterium]
AELFGHWWFEGPEWLSAFLEKAGSQESSVKLTTPAEYLAHNPLQQMASPAPSSWGENGYNDAWLDTTNNWVYPLLHKAADRMSELALAFPQPESLVRQALNQAGRELMLAQSSDWAFILKTGTSPEYASLRTKEHLSNFNKLYEQILKKSIDREWLNKLEMQNNIFPEMDYKIYL